MTSLEELRRALAPGDDVTVVPAAGQPVSGRLMRVGVADLDVQVADRPTTPAQGPQRVTIPLSDIQSLERRPDSVRNGALMGAAIGAGVGGTMFVYAAAIDRNELDEWAPFYLGATAVFTGVGALVGWLIDAANSQPHIRFEPSRGTKVSVHPVYSGGRGIAVAVSFSR
jgi:hypothetical protein